MPIATSKYELPNNTYCASCDSWYEGKGHTDENDKTVCPNCAELMGLVACDECKKWFNPDELHECHCGTYCDHCADNLDYHKCSNCHTYIHCDNSIDYCGETWCDDCAEEEGIRACDRCGESFGGDDLTDCDGDYYCERCMDRLGWCFCYNCNDVVGPNDQRSGADDCTYCDSCWGDRFSVCENCDNIIWNDDSIWIDDTCYCEDCARSHSEQEASGFNDSGNTFTRIGRRAFGVEIETNRCDDYAEITDNSAFGAKRDGSINGLEFYSTILSGDKGLDEINKLCDFAKKHDWNVARDCGLHVHFDMRSESDEGMKAIASAMLYTYEIWRDFVTSDRHSNHYCRKHNTEQSELFGISNFYNFAAQCENRDRYVWCNFRSYLDHKTFEVRLHHGSINGKEICNWVRAISILMDWAASKGWKGVRDAMLYRSKSDRFDFIKGLWAAAGCDDLIGWFEGKARNRGRVLAECA
jgi:hypothetical protein